MAPALLAPGPLLVVFAHLALDGLDRFQLLDRVMAPAGDDASLVEFARLVAPNEVLFRQQLISAEPAFAPIDYAPLPFRRPAVCGSGEGEQNSTYTIASGAARKATKIIG